MSRWAVAALAALIVACGGSTARKAAPEGRDTTGGVAAPRTEIEQLDARITAELQTLGLAPPDDTELTEMMVAHRTPALPQGTAAEACTTPPTCSDVCTLADSICASATRICELADQMAGDAWATQRCAAGKESCARARERCCSC